MNAEQDRERSKREDLEKCHSKWHGKNDERIEYFIANCLHKPDTGCEECSKYCAMWCGNKIF